MNLASFAREHRSFLQRCSMTLILCMVLILLLTACGSRKATPTPVSAENIFAEIQTSVAATLHAPVVVSAIPTFTSTVTATRTFTATPATASPTATRWYGPLLYYHCEDSQFLRDVTIPDGTILTPGAMFVKTWRFKNIGNCAWASDYWIAFVGGHDMDGSDNQIGTTVAINKKVDVTVVLSAPYQEGAYIGYWQLTDENGNPFGDLVHVRIIVAAATATSTATATFTATSTSTFTATATATPTYTLTSTSTPTASSTATSTDVPTATNTEETTPTSTATPTPTFTATPEVTDTTVPSETPTATPTLEE